MRLRDSESLFVAVGRIRDLKSSTHEALLYAPGAIF